MKEKWVLNNIIDQLKFAFRAPVQRITSAAILDFSAIFIYAGQCNTGIPNDRFFVMVKICLID